MINYVARSRSDLKDRLGLFPCSCEGFDSAVIVKIFGCGRFTGVTINRHKQFERCFSSVREVLNYQL